MTEPATTAKDLEKRARQAGLRVRRTAQGSIVEGADGRSVFLPRHPGPLPKGLVRLIVKALGLLRR